MHETRTLSIVRLTFKQKIEVNTPVFDFDGVIKSHKRISVWVRHETISDLSTLREIIAGEGYQGGVNNQKRFLYADHIVLNTAKDAVSYVPVDLGAGYTERLALSRGFVLKMQVSDDLLKEIYGEVVDRNRDKREAKGHKYLDPKRQAV
jgi:hypothetical protein